MATTEFDCSELAYNALMALAGFQDEHFKTIEKYLPVKIYLKSQSIKLEAENQRVLEKVQAIFEEMLKLIERDGHVDGQETARLCLLAANNRLNVQEASAQAVVRTRNGKMIYPKTPHQKQLVQAFRDSDIVFASGVAGTGKTYLAVAYAVDQLKKEEINRIVLTRPAVEAGESLGFLPGDMKEKVDPYLMPLYDALNEMLGADTVERYLEKGMIEIAPLAFMRGRTLNEAVVILDEAQNTTRSQMKMFLTRMGRKCQMIITGDVSQTDLIRKKDSGLIQASQILKGIDGISVIEMDGSDVVRNPLVQKIIERYDQVEEHQARKDQVQLSLAGE